MSLSFAISFAGNVSAAIKYDGLTVPEKASAYESGLILAQCLSQTEASESNVKNGQVGIPLRPETSWTVWDKTIIAYHQTLSSDDNVMSCSEYDAALAKGAIKRLGIDPIDFVCAMGAKRVNGSANCQKASGDFTAVDITRDKLVKYLKDSVGLDIDNPGNEVRYWRSYNVVNSYCVGTSVSQAEWDKEGGNTRYNYNDPTSGDMKYYLANSLKNEKPKYKNVQQGDTTCGEYWNRLNQYYPDYKAYAATLDSAAKDKEATSIANSQDPPKEETDAQSSCVVEGIGWIVCPLTNFLAGASDAAFGVISNFLKLNTGLYDQNSGTYTAWQAFRTLANVGFIIFFLVIIFSQLTGQGVSNYGIKKTLPRLIIAAVLINLSYFICQIAVDISQVLGVSLHQLLKGVAIGQGDGGSVTWTNVMGDILMGSGMVVGLAAVAGVSVAVVALSVSWPVMLVALLAVLMTIIILMGRQAAIVLLIVLSPFAFVAFMLPNTQQWFKRWYKMFFGLLMVFPIVGLLYGGGELASKIISSAANTGEVDAGAKFWLSVTALGVAAVPLIFTPALLKGALNATGSIGAKLSGAANKLNVGKTAKTSSRLGEATQGIKNGLALRRANRRVNSKLQKKIDNSRVGRAIGLDRGAGRALATIQQEEGKDLQLARVSLGDEVAGWKAAGKNTDDELVARAMDKSRSSSERSAAMHELASTGRDGAIRRIRSHANYDKDKDERMVQSAISANAGALSSKAPDLLKGKEGAFSNVNGEQLAGFSKDTAAEYAKYLGGLHKSATAPGQTPQQQAAQTAKFNSAMTSFQGSMRDIQSNPTLQAKFGGDIGKVINETFSDPSFNNPSSTSSFGAYTPSQIQADGKIR